MTEEAEDELMNCYTPRQLAKKLCISRKKVYDFIKSGAIPVVQIGHQKRIRPEVVDRILRTGIITA